MRGRGGAGALLLAACGTAAAAAPAEPAGCRAIDDDAARLACYDRLHGREAAPAPLPAAPAGGGLAPPARERTAPPIGAAAPSRPTISLGRLWELDPEHKRGRFKLQPHQANYFLPLQFSSRPNQLPSSPTPGHTVAEPLPLDPVEGKFQLSFKAKVWENVIGNRVDLWFAYTQQSHWQLYNGDASSAFRETNYQPEVVVAMRTRGEWLGWRWRMLNLGFAHQSNGRGLPLSRSWNRVYAQFGFERGDFTLLVRPWARIAEDADSDDNPDIRDYLGTGDVRLAWAGGGHVVSALARRRAVQLDWAFPIAGSLKGYVQATRGYGESLIDYNHSQNTLGLGILLLPWE